MGFETATKETKYFEIAIKQCVNLHHDLQLSLIKIKILKNKYCYPISSINTPRLLFNKSKLIEEANKGSHDGKLSQNDTKINMKIFQSLQCLMHNNNKLNVQIIKIKRDFEAILTRVEYLVRVYSKKTFTPAPNKVRKTKNSNCMYHYGCDFAEIYYGRHC